MDRKYLPTDLSTVDKMNSLYSQHIFVDSTLDLYERISI